MLFFFVKQNETRQSMTSLSRPQINRGHHFRVIRREAKTNVVHKQEAVSPRTCAKYQGLVSTVVVVSHAPPPPAQPAHLVDEPRNLPPRARPENSIEGRRQKRRANAGGKRLPPARAADRKPTGACTCHQTGSVRVRQRQHDSIMWGAPQNHPSPCGFDGFEA